MYSLTSSRVLDDKLPVLHRLALAPAVVFDTLASLTARTAVQALDAAVMFTDPPLVHLPFREVAGQTMREDMASAASLTLSLGFRMLLVHSFLPVDGHTHASAAPEPVLGGVRNVAETHGARILVENTDERDVDEFCALLEWLDAEAVVDLHRLRLCDQRTDTWVEALGSRLWGLHVYGSNGMDEHSGLTDADRRELARVAERLPMAPRVLLDVPRADLEDGAKLLAQAW